MAAEYWPSIVLHVYGRRRSQGLKTSKKEEGQHPATLSEQAWSIKDLLCGFRGNVLCGTWQVVPSGLDSFIFHARVANHSAECDSSCALVDKAL